MIRVAGREALEGRVTLSRSDELVIEGEGVSAVSSGGQPWESSAQRDVTGRERRLYRPPGRLLDTLNQTTGAVEIQVIEAGSARTIAVARAGTLFDEEEIQSLRDALAHLAWSTRNPQAVVASTRAGHSGTATTDLHARMEGLFAALSVSLPVLLERPLREHRYVVGPVPVARARPSPRTLLLRASRPDQREILDRHPAEVQIEGDYAWLGSVVAAVARYAEDRARETPTGDAAISEAHPSRVWARRRPQLRQWQRHPTLAAVAGARPRPPGWVLGQSVPGARILRAVRATPVAAQVLRGGRGLGGRGDHVLRAPMALDSRLYELWLFLEVAYGLQAPFGFRLLDEEAWFDGEETAQGWQHAPLRFQWEGPSLFGATQQLTARLEHGPALAARGGGVLTPDLVLTLQGNGRESRHVIDAKCRREAFSEARRTARGYLHDLAAAPLSVYVASPSPLARLADFAARIRSGIGDREKLDDQRVGPVHGFSWGHLYARPPRPPEPALGEFSQPGPLGAVQFLVMALQYHRSELRHVCTQCGHRLTEADVTHRPARGRPGGDLRAAHEDRVGNDGRLASNDEIAYRCPMCAQGETPSEWIRSACVNGHVLLKHGRLTPHRRRDGSDQPDPFGQNVECVVCGHYRRGRSASEAAGAGR